MIFYFTGTGNSLYAAERLGKALNERLVNIIDVMGSRQFAFKLKDGERVGLVFPVYFYGIPTVVDEFLGRLRFEDNEKTYFFSVLTCGGYIGAADRQLFRKAMRSGYRLSGLFSLVMPNNYVLSYELPTPEEQRSMLAEADGRLKEIADAITAGKTGGHGSGAVGRLVTFVSYPVYVHGRKTAKFWAEDTCIGCGRCERDCPSGAIIMNDKRPEWRAKQCILCLSCINRCPVSAIQYGRRTKDRRRYVNPVLKNGGPGHDLERRETH